MSTKARVKALIPPIGYSQLDEDLYRIVGSISQHNVWFLQQLNLKSVVYISEIEVCEVMTSFCEENGIKVISDSYLNLENCSLETGGSKVGEIALSLCDNLLYPLLIVGSSGNFADICVIAYLRKLQRYDLVSIFWEMELLAMKKLVELEQFLENLIIPDNVLASIPNPPLFLSRTIQFPSHFMEENTSEVRRIVAFAMKHGQAPPELPDNALITPYVEYDMALSIIDDKDDED